MPAAVLEAKPKSRVRKATARRTAPPTLAEEPRFLRFACPACAKAIRVKASAKGKRGACPSCKRSLIFPDSGASKARLAVVELPVPRAQPSAVPPMARRTGMPRAERAVRATPPLQATPSSTVPETSWMPWVTGFVAGLLMGVTAGWLGGRAMHAAPPDLGVRAPEFGAPPEPAPPEPVASAKPEPAEPTPEAEVAPSDRRAEATVAEARQAAPEPVPKWKETAAEATRTVAEPPASNEPAVVTPPEPLSRPIEPPALTPAALDEPAALPASAPPVLSVPKPGVHAPEAPAETTEAREQEPDAVAEAQEAEVAIPEETRAPAPPEPNAATPAVKGPEAAPDTPLAAKAPSPVLPVKPVLPAKPAELTSAREVHDRVDKRYQGDDSKSKLVLVLTNRRGEKRVSRLIRFRREVNHLSKTMLSYTSPADVRGTTTLTIEQEAEDDLQRIYIPAMKKNRRIATADKGRAWAGTDFSYEDLQEHELDDWTYSELTSDTWDGQDCYFYTTQPSAPDKSCYGKVENWVRKDILQPIGARYYDKEGKLFKELRFTKLQEIQGVWTSLHWIMVNVQEEHKTEFIVERVLYNSGISDEMFTPRSMTDVPQDF